MPDSPTLHKIEYLSDSSEYFRRLKILGQRIWLDSGKPSSHYGRFDILCAMPIKVLYNPTIAEIDLAVQALADSTDSKTLKELQLPFCGGAMGYFNYEYDETKLSEAANGESESSGQLSVFGIFDWALIQDHEQRKASLIFLPSCQEDKRVNIIDCLTREAGEVDKDQVNKSQINKGFEVKHLHADLKKSDYLAAIDDIKQYILAGDTYQINFSQRFSGEFSGAADEAYLALRRALPSPFSAYCELGEDTILSLSPERFISLRGDRAVTQPIKGTAPRGKSVLEDDELAQRLLNSDKNRAENLMIVDLLRNDFSKSCLPHSVKTAKLFSLESYVNVHHLVSTIIGKLKPDVRPLEFLMGCFPGGSITGAPKRRAMQIIRELETQPRHIYCGSLCYQSIDGQLDSNIAIRTLLISKNRIYCWGGGGIVVDSNAEEEYAESLQKIDILLTTLSTKK